MRRVDFAIIIKALSGFLVVFSGGTLLIFSILFFYACDYDLYFSEKVFVSLSVGIVSLLVVLSFVFLGYDRKFAYKLCVFTIIISLLAVCGLYFLKITGIYDKFESIDAFRLFIAKFEKGAAIAFVLAQLLQVVALPIPSFILIGAGVLLFGPLKCAIFSFIGIYSGTLISFYIGKRYGTKFIGWLIGKDKLSKLLILSGKNNKFLLTCMFIFPFFPDDLLCFVSGLSGMNFKYFAVMTFITRAISVFTSAYSVNNSLIPYNTWWGILIWITIFCFGLIFSYLVNKKLNKSKTLDKH